MHSSASSQATSLAAKPRSLPGGQGHFACDGRAVAHHQGKAGMGSNDVAEQAGGSEACVEIQAVLKMAYFFGS
jgi:hypothetical protein